MKSLEKQLKKSNNMDSTTRAHIDHANKEEWTKKELATLSEAKKEAWRARVPYEPRNKTAWSKSLYV